jgi:hypothetical protein
VSSEGDSLNQKHVKPLPAKYLSSVFRKYVIVCMRPAFTRGALRDRHERWRRDAMDVSSAPDVRVRCGRPSRVVLPLPNENNVLELSNGILRALIHLGFLPVCLTVRGEAASRRAALFFCARHAATVAERCPPCRASLRTSSPMPWRGLPGFSGALFGLP